MTSFVITGSSKGIGLALARYCRSQGHGVVIVGRDPRSVDAAVAKLKDEMPSAAKLLGVATDICDPQQVEDLWCQASEALGSVDVWINNAGVAHTTKPIIEITPDDVRSMVRTNVQGTINGSQVAARGMLAQGHGRLFNVLGGGSDGEYFPGMGVYGATKRGLDYFTRALVKELKGSPVLVGRVRPGMVVTEGMIREIQAAPENFESSRRIMNILGDKPDTVAPYLIEKMLAMPRSGGKIAWLNGLKIGRRFLSARFKPREDLFKDVVL